VYFVLLGKNDMFVLV
jgi:hypothetical protein